MLARTPERARDLPGARTLDAGDGPAVHYVDTGEADFSPVVFLGGVGTSAGALWLTEPCAPGQRARLRLRLVSVERNGFGDTPLAAGAGFTEAVDDVLAVLDALRIDRFSVVAISGGGPYAARLIERVPERVVSVHLAAATSGGELLAGGAAAAMLADLESIAADPEGFWDYPAESPVGSIPGFVAACHEEGRRALGDPRRAAAALRHELNLLCSEELPDLRALAAPAFLYWGAHDELVPVEQARAWQAALGRNVTVRVYADAGHDVQYLHWNDVLADLAAEAAP